MYCHVSVSHETTTVPVHESGLIRFFSRSLHRTNPSSSVSCLLSALPRGRVAQGQLHQFMKIEHCIEPITSYERNHSFSYSWILWTRLDSFWSAYPPPIRELDPAAYIVPSGQGGGGVNDRCGIGPRHLALPALRRCVNDCTARIKHR